MRIITDLHLHSKYSRSCSKDLTLPNIAKTCERKGINFVGTADCLHPAWRKEITNDLEVHDGAFYLKDGSSKTAFCLTTEVSCIYKHRDKTRRLHHVVVFPDLKAVDGTIAALESRGMNLKSDGRPIMGLDSKSLLKLLLDVDPRILLIPAHAWTPWFAIFGSKSGYDSLEECFDELTPNIYAIETGLSSDPPMNWRVSALDKLFLVSNSDAHSCDNLGREANVFEMSRPSFSGLRDILVTHDLKSFIETFEFFPEEGKYHADGCANCKFWCEPEKSVKLGGKCPTCGRPLTIGVLARVKDLSDRGVNSPQPPQAVPFRHLIPLREVIADVLGKSKTTKSVKAIYDKALSCATEFDILLNLSAENLHGLLPGAIVEGIMDMREGNVSVRPGYDGIFGEIHVCDTSRKTFQQNLL